jgi:hypothetical protein
MSTIELDTEKPADGNDDAAIIAEVKRRLTWALANEGDNRAEAKRDLAFLKGDHWDAQVKAQRDADRRPSLTINKLPTFVQQVTNDLRMNKPAIKVAPVDDNADEETAEVIQGIVRHIEYDSNADVCYDTAGTHAAESGCGYWRLVTDYESPDSFDQVIKFDRIRNRFSVYLGPHKEADASDMPWALIAVEMTRDDFRAEYPDADMASFDSVTTQGDRQSGWVTNESVRVVEYYRIERTPDKLCLLPDGRTVYKSESPKGYKPVRERDTYRQSVHWYKVSATEILASTEVLCEWIPIFKVVGGEIDDDGEVTYSGVIRHARDPQYMYDLWMSSATEEVALRTKTPFIGAEGQFKGYERDWKQANVRNFPYLTYRPTTVDGILVPPPQRQQMADIPSGALQMAMHANDNIKATTGIFDASLGARGNETSGKAIQARQREGDTANYHITDNVRRAIRHCGRCLLSMIPRYYDTPRIVRILGDDETPGHATVNTPELDENGIERVMRDLRVGRYDVVVTMGPSFATKRQEAADAMVQFGQAWPRLMDIAGDKVVKAMDWPGADDIAERIKRSIPTELRGDEEGEQQAPQIPPEVQQAVQQMQAHIQQLEAALAEAQSGAEKDRIRADASVEVARISAESRRDVAEIAGWVQLLAKNIQPPPVLTAAATDLSPVGPDAAGEMAQSVPTPSGLDGQESMQ